MNSITELLDLEDADIFISDISISGTQKILQSDDFLPFVVSFSMIDLQ